MGTKRFKVQMTVLVQLQKAVNDTHVQILASGSCPETNIFMMTLGQQLTKNTPTSAQVTR